MAKEKKAAVEKTVVIEKTKKVPEVKKPTWEVKDRVYYLKGDKTPLTLTIPCKHTRKHALLYFDPETQTQREIRYATNQNSPFADEQKGEATLGHVTFRDGVEMHKRHKSCSIGYNDKWTNFYFGCDAVS